MTLLLQALEALEHCYDITEWPGGESAIRQFAAITALRAAIEAGAVVVPKEPTEEMWSHLARDIVFWLYSSSAPHHGAKLHEFLRNCGTPIPEWLTREISDSDNTPPKGTVAVAIYKAMIAPTQEDGK